MDNKPSVQAVELAFIRRLIDRDVSRAQPWGKDALLLTLDEHNEVVLNIMEKYVFPDTSYNTFLRADLKKCIDEEIGKVTAKRPKKVFVYRITHTQTAMVNVAIEAVDEDAADRKLNTLYGSGTIDKLFLDAEWQCNDCDDTEVIECSMDDYKGGYPADLEEFEY